MGGGGAEENRGGGSGMVRGGSAAAPAGSRPEDGAGEGAGSDDASRWPHVTQKRSPRWLALPQSGHGLSATGAVAAGGSPSRPKLTSGAEGRRGATAGTGPSGGGGAGARGVAGTGIPGRAGEFPPIASGGELAGARAVAASGDASSGSDSRRARTDPPAASAMRRAEPASDRTPGRKSDGSGCPGRTSYRSRSTDGTPAPRPESR